MYRSLSTSDIPLHKYAPVKIPREGVIIECPLNGQYHELLPLVGSLEENPLAVKLLDNRLYMSRKGPEDGLRDIRLRGGLNVCSYSSLSFFSVQ